MNRKQRRAAAKRETKVLPENHAGLWIADHLAVGIKLQQSGRLAEAERYYREILAADPQHAESLHLLGVIAYQTGHYDAAERLIHQAIERNDRDARYFSNLGNALYQQRKLNEAIAAYQRSITIKADYAESYANLGVVFKDQGRVGEAIIAFQKAVSIKPTFAIAYWNLAAALNGERRHAEAVTASRTAAELSPNFAEAYCELGIALNELGKTDDAIDALSSAVRINPNSPQYRYNLGVALRAQGALDPAIAAYREAIRLEPGFAQAAYNLGLCLQEQRKPEEAIVEYRRAVRLKPDFAKAYSNLGVALEELGQLDQARDAYEKAIECAPHMAGTYRLLADITKLRADDPRFANMEKLLREPASISSGSAIDLHFALGKTYADVEQYDLSFRHLLDGNKLKRQQVPYNESAMLAMFNRIKSVFRADLLREKSGIGYSSSVPIFIVGMPRSGSSLIEQILASHPQVYGAGELETLPAAVEQLRANGQSSRFPEAVTSMTRNELHQLGSDYVASVRARAPEAERITDKMPMNFLFVGLIHLMLPDARIIHAQRDPLDTCVSCFSKLFTGDQAFSYDLAELGNYYRRYAALMDHWRRVLPSGAMLEVKYETLVADLSGEARRIVEYSGLQWDEKCLAFYETKRSVHTASAAQVRRPIYASSVGRWRHYEQHLRPLFAALGQDLNSKLA